MKISIISPFYNEALILENCVRATLAQLKDLKEDWEWILVNDGSTDHSLNIAKRLVSAVATFYPQLRLISYSINQGRGYALRSGIEAARGDIIVTTEIDATWGEDIVSRIVSKFKEDPGTDAVLASPHLPGGGYKNVPWTRVLLSTFGNALIRFFFTKKITMNTGMTRGYRRNAIQCLPIESKGKEFHLEVLLKLLTLGYNVVEIPAIIEWKASELWMTRRQRRASVNVSALIYTHLLFTLFANPIRYFWLLSLIGAVCGTTAMGWGTYNLIVRHTAVYLILLSILFFVVSLLFFGFGIVTAQNRLLEKEAWRTQLLLRQIIAQKEKGQVVEPNQDRHRLNNVREELPKSIDMILS